MTEKEAAREKRKREGDKVVELNEGLNTIKLLLECGLLITGIVVLLNINSLISLARL